MRPNNSIAESKNPPIVPLDSHEATMPDAMTDNGSVSTIQDAAPCGRHIAPWFCVWTKPNQERLADHSLRVEGFPTYLPMHLATRADRTTVIEPLFPRYMFCQPTDDGQWVGMLFARGVAAVIRTPFGVPRPVPTAAVERLLAQCAPNRVIYPPEPKMLLPTETGRVTAGPFAEFVGICTRTARDRVWLLLEVLGRPTEVGFSRASVQAA